MNGWSLIFGKLSYAALPFSYSVIATIAASVVVLGALARRG